LLAVKLRTSRLRHASEVAARPRQAGDKTRSNRVFRKIRYRRHLSGSLLSRVLQPSHASDHKHIDATGEQLCEYRWRSFGITFRRATIKDDIGAICPSEVAQTMHKPSCG
jgi:hypothetical protein